MNRPAIPAVGHAGFDVLRLGRRVAAEPAGEAVDAATNLSMPDRYALAVLSLAVDVEASRRAGVEPLTEQARVWLAGELAAIERATCSNHPAPLQAAG